MRVLVLGAAGQVGRAIAATAPNHVELVQLGRTECDISDAAATRDAFSAIEPKLVVNAAAYTAVDRAEDDAEAADMINAQAPGHIAAAASSIGAGLVHFSTDYVFDGKASQPYRPNDPTAPLGVYGRTKLAGERAALAGHSNALIVRTAGVYAATGENFLNTMLRLMKERDEVAVVVDQVTTPTYAHSLASAAWSLALSGETGIWHYTDSGVASWYDFAVAISEEAFAADLLKRPVAIKPITTVQFPTRAKRPQMSLLDKSDTWEALKGAAPHWRVNLRAALKDLKAVG